MTTTTAETKAEKKEPRDGDRERIVAAAIAAHVAIVNLDNAAIAAASRHDHQVDMLKKEVERLQKENDELRARVIRDETVAPMAPAIVVDAAPIGPWVIMRNDANGRRFWGTGGRGPHMCWGSVDAAHTFDDGDDANGAKPRGSKVVTLLEAIRLVESDATSNARIAAATANLHAGEPTDG